MLKNLNGSATIPPVAAPFCGRPESSASKSSSNALANAKRGYERYVALAKASAMTGDAVETENYYQHADHYFRVIKAGGL
jgi:hypothetical protein